MPMTSASGYRKLEDEVEHMLKRLEESDEIRRKLLDRLTKDSHEAGEVKATMMVNFGKPFDGFPGGRIAQIVERGWSATKMFVAIAEHYKLAEVRAE